MMSWSEFLSHLLESSHKVDKAAVFNTKGQPLVTSEDLQVTNADGSALLNCLRDPARSLTRITIDDTDFRCFQGNNNALVGVATNKSGRVLVARLTEEALVMVVGSSSGHGSFLYEVQKNLLEHSSRQLAANDFGAAASAREGSQRAIQQAVVIPPPAVFQEQVLVQIHE